MDVVKILLEYARPGVDRRAELNFALRLAVNEKKAEVTEALLAAGADANQFDGEENPPLFTAIVNNDLKTVQCLVSHGANLNQLNKNDHTPLMMAFGLNYADIAEYLTSVGK